MSNSNKTPTKLWMVYYQGLSGEWHHSYPTPYKKNAKEMAKVYGDGNPAKLLEYRLTREEDVTITKKTKKVKKIVKSK